MPERWSSSRWIFQHFHKDKCRFTERYYHQQLQQHCLINPTTAVRIPMIENESGGSGCGLRIVLIPDGQFLRKYLGLLEELLQQQQQLQSLGTGTGTGTMISSIALVVLESAAELMDHRNNSPSSITTVMECEHVANSSQPPPSGSSSSTTTTTKTLQTESAAINERNRIFKLWQAYGPEASTSSSSSFDCASLLIPFADLTSRYRNISSDNDDNDEEEDEFDLFHYDGMSVENRSRCALMRAARLIQASNINTGTSSRGKKDGNGNGNGKKANVKVIVLSQDELLLGSNNENAAADDDNSDDNDVKVMSCSSLIEFLWNNMRSTNKGDMASTVEEKEEDLLIRDHWHNLRKRCEKIYRKRNMPETETDVTSPLDSYGHFEYYPPEQIQKGLEEKKYFRAELKVSDENPKEAYCLIRNAGDDSTSSTSGGSSTLMYYLNENNGSFNRAIHEDSVIIEPLPENQWEEPLGRRHLVHISTDDEDNDGKDNDGSRGTNVVPTARVVGIDTSGRRRRRRRKYVATMMRQSGAAASATMRDDTNILVIPMDLKIPRVRIKTRIHHDQIVNRRLLIEIDTWDVGSSNPTGHLVKILGDVGDLDTEVSCLLMEHSIDLSPFSANALACLPPVQGGEDWSIGDEEILKRRDLRTSCRIFSVDPVGCQDIDDAMHARVLANGDVEVGVHIADVTHFLQHDSPLDKEARRRSTTFYLVDRRFDMLPSLLSSDLCSLHDNIDRLAVSVIWTLSPDLETVKSTWYGRTVIHNAHAMTYEQAHNILHDIDPDGPDATPPPPLTAGGLVDKASVSGLKHDLAILTKFTRILRKRRETLGGAVDLSSGDRGSELKFVLDSDGQPKKVTPKTDLEIHHTIAELMILANNFVAETIYGSFQDSALLRIHSQANVGNFEELENLFQASGIGFDGKSNRALAKSLDDAKSSKGGSNLTNSLFQSLATRAMSEAQYVCTGSLKSGILLSHYGLGIELYTHFTSPIRRYADVVVHRLLIASLVRQQDPHLSPSIVPKKGGESSLIPESNAISVLQGEGLEDNSVSSANGSEPELDDDDFLDSLIEGAEDMVLGEPANDEDKEEQPTQQQHTNVPYQTSEVATICERLNHQNRIAKLSSMQCQRLFLSLYFRENIEVTQAVVIDLKRNGLVVYVPRFDMKAPVFLADKSGNVQVDPVLFGAPANSGLSPSPGFARLKTSRMFPDGCCTLHDDESNATDPRLELSIPGSKRILSFSRLDVISVQVSCDLTDVTARIPPPRLHLVSVGQKHSNSMKGTSTAPSLVKDKENKKAAEDPAGIIIHPISSERRSMFDVLSSIEINSDLNHLAPRFKSAKKAKKIQNRKQTIKGRLYFNGFKADELEPEVVDLEAEARTGHGNDLSLGGQAVMGNYDASRRIEREATARMQRQAAERRNAKKSKALKRK